MFHKQNKLVQHRRSRARKVPDSGIVVSRKEAAVSTTYVGVDCHVNEIKQAIRNNDPIEDKLNVIIVVSNPCLYSRRYTLLKEFVARIEHEEPDVRLFTVELAYGDQEYAVTSSDNPRHLQLRTAVPLWHKENMINIAVKRLLEPMDYKAFAWIDADVEFDSPTWAMDTLKILNGTSDVVQLFSHCIFMARDTSTMEIFTGMAFNYVKGNPSTEYPLNFWHPGFGWAMTRKTYDQLGRLYDSDIFGGSGDMVMAWALIGNAHMLQPRYCYSEDYKASMAAFAAKSTGLRLGYTPGIVRHYFHGSLKNRKYIEREKIIMKYDYSPTRDIMYDSNGIIVPTQTFPLAFQEEIIAYFHERKEDD